MKAGVLYRAIPDAGEIETQVGDDGKPRFGWPVRIPFPRDYYDRLRDLAEEYWYPNSREISFRWVINLCHDAEQFRGALTGLERLGRETGCTIFNAPEAVARTAPDRLAGLAEGLGGLVAPSVLRVETAGAASLGAALAGIGMLGPVRLVGAAPPRPEAILDDPGKPVPEEVSRRFRGQAVIHAEALDPRRDGALRLVFAVSADRVVPVRAARGGEVDDAAEQTRLAEIGAEASLKGTCAALRERSGLDFCLVAIDRCPDGPDVLRTVTADLPIFDRGCADRAFLERNPSIAREVLLAHRDAILLKFRSTGSSPK